MNKYIISIKPEKKPKPLKKIAIEIDKVHEIIAEQNNQLAMEFLYELLDPYYPNCHYCGNVFYAENPRRMYCDDCKANDIHNKLWVQNHKEQDRLRKREWARKRREQLKQEVTNETQNNH